MPEQSIINSALHFVIDLLDPINHYQYHNLNHTLDVYSRAGYLCDKEFVSEEDRNDILMAALFHDTGFVEQYYQNEQIGAKIAREYLTKIAWPEERIKKIEGLIMATVLFSEPKNKLEQIMQDADLDNLGRKDCFIKTLLYRKEMREIGGQNIPKEQWFVNTHNLLRAFEYRTMTSREERTEIKEINAEKMHSRIEMHVKIREAIEAEK